MTMVQLLLKVENQDIMDMRSDEWNGLIPNIAHEVAVQSYYGMARPIQST